MEISVRKAALSDYEEVLRIMSQVQDMHVTWRPDVYKPNNQLFSKEDFKAALAGDVFYVQFRMYVIPDNSLLGVEEIKDMFWDKILKIKRKRIVK